MKAAATGVLSLVGSAKPAEAALPAAPSIGVSIVNRESLRLIWCNAAGEQHLRWSLEPDAALRAYLSAGEFCLPLKLATPHGAVLSVEALPFIDSDWLLLSRDITASERLEAMRRDFVADTSHELRAPLSVMAGLLETVTELDLDPDRAHAYLDLMAEQCKRMRNIVDGLLELSALEGSPEPGHDQRVDVAALVARLRAEAEVLSGGRHTLVLDAQPGYDLLGSERDITSGLSNLVANAVRYTPPGGEVRIVWRASSKGAEFAVEDTGVGIDAKHIPLLTERFYRVQKAMNAGGRRPGGAGLGLAIVKAALSRHQATLEITSEAGKGSRFVARFPAHRVSVLNAAVSTLAA
jgi:two-component system phosphate regulon sensor histidine kinase PhoR